MILEVIQAAGVEPAPWWMSAQSPWWAAPVSTLAGAMLAWFLARLTSGRNARIAEARELRQLKREVYSDLWAAALEHHRRVSMGDRTDGQDATIRAMEQMLTIELLAPKDVHEAALKLVNTMTNLEATGSDRGKAMSMFRQAVASELKLTSS